MSIQTNVEKKVPRKRGIIRKFFGETWSAWTLLILYYYGNYILNNFLTILITLGITLLAGLILWGFCILFLRKFGCKVCDRTGNLNGENKMLGLVFNKHECYSCHGWKLVLSTKTGWYGIAMRANETMNRQKKRCSDAKEQIILHNHDVQIGKNLIDDNLRKRAREQKKALLKQLEFEQSRYDLYNVIMTNAHLIMHKTHLHKTQNIWAKKIAKSSEDRIDRCSSAVADGEDVRLAHLFESELYNLDGYLDNIMDEEFTDELIMDVKKATKKLRKEFLPDHVQIAKAT